MEPGRSIEKTYGLTPRAAHGIVPPMENAPTPSARLPLGWQTFVDRVALGASGVDAARAVGWQDPADTAAALLSHPTVRKALAQACQVRLEGRSVPLALDTIDEILQDKTAPKAVRAKLALGVVDRLVKRQAIEGGPEGKPLASMTIRELEQAIAQLSQNGTVPGQMRDVTPG